MTPRISRRDFIKTGGAAVAGAWASTSLLGRALADDSPAGRPNIFLLTIDTLRRDHCSAFGYKYRTTPFLGKLAAQGARFDQYVSTSSWTTPSIMSMFTGLSPIQHGVVDTKQVLPGKIPTLAGELRKLGYHTIGVLCNPCASGKMGFDAGFDIYDDFTILFDFELNLFDVGAAEKKSIHRTSTSRMTTNLVMKYMRKAPKGKPVFLFVLYFDPHGDYVPTGKYASMFGKEHKGTATGKVYGLPKGYAYKNPQDLEHVRALYDGEIRQTDDEVKRLMSLLEDRGYFSDRDLLICTSDHGEEFCEHGGLTHGRTLYEEVVRVPFLMRWPGRILPGKVVPGLVNHQDLMPTILKAAGWQGRSNTNLDLIDMANGKITTGRESMGMHLSLMGGMIGMRSPDWSVFRKSDSGQVEAFNLQNDPGQKKPVKPNADPKAKMLLASLDAWFARETALAVKTPKAARKKAKLSKQQVQALKAMGYIH